MHFFLIITREVQRSKQVNGVVFFTVSIHVVNDKMLIYFSQSQKKCNFSFVSIYLYVFSSETFIIFKSNKDISKIGQNYST